MKILSTISVVLFFSSPLFAQQPEQAPTSELAKLRRDYAESLDRLLRQCVKGNDVVAAAAVSQELDKVSHAIPDLSPNISPCGVWSWIGVPTAVITADGIATSSGKKGIWRWTNETKRQFQIEWQNGFVDQLTISPDGTKLHGVNNLDFKFSVERLPSPAKGIASTTTR